MAEPRGFDPTVSSGYWDRVLKALANERSRLIVDYLRQSAEVTTVSDLSNHLECQTGNSRKEILVMLHHSNLPMLDQVGLIEFEPAVGLIEYKGDSRADELIDAVISESHRS